MTNDYNQFLAHYGVKGQKWGNRQWQFEDGTYTEAGKERYWGGDGQRQRSAQPQTAYTQRLRQKAQQRQQISQKQTLRQPSPAEIEARKEARRQKRNKILVAAGAVALTAIGIAAYRKITKGKRDLRKDIKFARRHELEQQKLSLQSRYDSLMRDRKAGKLGSKDFKAQASTMRREYKELNKQGRGKTLKSFAKSIIKNANDNARTQDWINNSGLSFRSKKKLRK